MDDFFARARALERAGRPFVTATVVRVDKPTSGRPGNRAIVTLEGELYGWVGGSCARPTVIEEAAKALRKDRSRLVRLSTRPSEEAGREGLTDLSMTCFSGGTMEIFIEPHQPEPELAIFGDQPVARTLAELGDVLGYRVASGWNAERIHPLTFVVVATHGDHDEISLEEALRSPAPYVGLVASGKRAGSIREYLVKRGIGEGQLARLRAPAGLDIQAHSPEEIALSILAEIVQVRRNLPEIDWQSVADVAGAGGSAPSDVATDPVCGMSVSAASAEITHGHAGDTYYFCCVGCRDKFSARPEEYLSA
ncbi:MAG: XdhC family protein [Thermoanaerobaculia bacterium]